MKYEQSFGKAALWAGGYGGIVSTIPLLEQLREAPRILTIPLCVAYGVGLITTVYKAGMYVCGESEEPIVDSWRNEQMQKLVNVLAAIRDKKAATLEEKVELQIAKPTIPAPETTGQQILL